MTYKLKFLSRENQINRILKTQKRNKSKIAILFYSKWDGVSQSLLSDLEHADSLNGELSGKINLYLINSFQMPHSFVIFKTQKVPHLVILNGDKVTSIDYLPLVCKELGV